MSRDNVTVGSVKTVVGNYEYTYFVKVTPLGNIEVSYGDSTARHRFDPDDIDFLIDHLISARDMSPAVVAAHKAAEEATKLAEQAKQAVLEKIARGEQ